MFGDPGTSFAGRRLGGLVVLMDGDRPDGNELCEWLLDQPNPGLAGKPLRWAVDNRTQYKFMGGARGGELLAGCTRFVAGEQVTADYQILGMVYMNLLYGGHYIAPLANIRIDTFEFDHQPGCYAWLWDSAPVELSAAVACRGCRTVYDFSSRAGMMPGNALPEGGAHEPDMLMESVGAEFRGIPPAVLQHLREGKRRRWWCEKCQREQGYPGSLIQAAL